MTAKPNILLITSDQHRADSMGIAGHPCVRTPHLDALALAGTRYTNAYSTCPICMPARTSIVTGLHPHHFDMPGNNDSFVVDRPRNLMVASLLREAGYQTELVGKTHFLADPSDRMGFDHVTHTRGLYRKRLEATGQVHAGTGTGGNEMEPAPAALPPELSQTHWCTEECLEFLDTRDETQPFFLWASYEAPHPPMVVHEPYFSMYDGADIPEPFIPQWMDNESAPLHEYSIRYRTNPLPASASTIRKIRSVYYGMITYMDHQIGRLLGRIQAQGELDNTLVIYTTDHGEKLGDLGSFWKGSFVESSANVPLIVRPPETSEARPGRTSDELVCLEDLLPTICDYAGARVLEDIDGRSLRRSVAGSDRDRAPIWGLYRNCAHMLRDQTHKYVYYPDDGSELLFDMRSDRREADNLANERSASFSPELVERYRTHLLERLRGEHHADGGLTGLVNREHARPSRESLAAKHLQWLGLRRAGQATDLIRFV